MTKPKLAAAALAALLCVGATGGANALTIPGQSRDSLNLSLKRDAACQGPGRWCGPGFVRACGPFRCWCRPCR